MTEQSAREQTVGCADVAELLPVFLNGSLQAAEQRRFRAHIASCAACRQEERDARAARSLFDGHLPVEMLVDYALGQSMPPKHQAVIESHLAGCERCSEEVAAVRGEKARTEPSEETSPVTSRSRKGSLEILAWAASFVAIVASAGWLWTWQELVDERARARALTARANPAVVELLPANQSPLRQGDADSRATANHLELAEDTDELVLVLLGGGRICVSGCFLEIHRPERGSAPLQRIDDLIATPDGHLTLALPSRWLPIGSAVLAVVDQASGELGAEYLVETSVQ